MNLSWKDIEHIHVVRKLREIISNWFKVDILFVDNHGKIRNLSGVEAGKWKNNLIHNSFESSNLNILKKLAENENEFHAANNPEKHEFMISSELHGVSFPIILRREYLGCVMAVCYRTKDKIVSKKSFEEFSKEIKISKSDMSEFFMSFHKIEEADRKYFHDLVNLITQEIMALHLELSEKEERIQALQNDLGERHSYSSMVGKSKPMQDLYSLLDKIKNTESIVLVEGENGTGKELIAKAIHYNSARKDKGFLAINCAAFNDNLLESELFGHVKGAFTGAVRDRKGYFESADKGTLFMDEIGDISTSMQVKLLRVLQDGTFTPVGSNEMKTVNVRIIAATNRNLKRMVEENEFRQDLYFRLNVIGIRVPKLSERKDDLPLLVEHFLNKSSKDKGLVPRKISKMSMEKLFDYEWPGNIRELENEMERCTVLSGEETLITPDMLSPRIQQVSSSNGSNRSRTVGKLRDAVEELERGIIRDGLRRNNWNKSQLAKEIGISRAGLLMKIDKYGLDKRTYSRNEANLKKSNG